MKRFFIAFCALFLVSCYSGEWNRFIYAHINGGNVRELVLNVEYIRLDFYLDQGFVKVFSGPLYLLKGAPEKDVVDALLADSLCGWKDRGGWMGCAIVQDSQNATSLNLDCMLYVDYLYLNQSSSFFDVVTTMYKERHFDFSRDRHFYKFSYTGPELDIEGNFVKKRNEGDLHIIEFPVNVDRHTIILKMEKNGLSRYKPLRLDPSILPLESPGYKKLREQEESRMKGD